MTNEKALDLLDNLVGMIGDNQNNDYDDALCIAIAALEKQKMKRPNKIWRSEGRVSHGECPICRRLTFDTSNYCHGCGQALDWTEERLHG